MNVVFLDMDGVLNSAAFFDSQPEPAPDPKTDRWWTQMVDPAAVQRLNRIIKPTQAKVVISSSWRYHCTPEDMQRILDAKGFEGEVIGRTPLNTELPMPPHEGLSRGVEVEVWLAKNKHLDVSGFVILDDFGEQAFAYVASHLVQTSWARGLLDEHIPRALSLLGA